MRTVLLLGLLLMALMCPAAAGAPDPDDQPAPTTSGGCTEILGAQVCWRCEPQVATSWISREASGCITSLVDP